MWTREVTNFHFQNDRKNGNLVRGNALEILAISSFFRQECTISVQICGKNGSILRGRFGVENDGWLDGGSDMKQKRQNDANKQIYWVKLKKDEKWLNLCVGSDKQYL